MDFKALAIHFSTHFAIAFVATTVIIAAINLLNSGEIAVDNWLLPIGVGLAIGIGTTIWNSRKADE